MLYHRPETSRSSAHGAPAAGHCRCAKCWCNLKVLAADCLLRGVQMGVRLGQDMQPQHDELHLGLNLERSVRNHLCDLCCMRCRNEARQGVCIASILMRAPDHNATQHQPHPPCSAAAHLAAAPGAARSQSCPASLKISTEFRNSANLNLQ